MSDLEFRSVPRSDDAERGVLSCLLEDAPRLAPVAQTELSTECFYHPSNRLIFEEILFYCSQPTLKPLDLPLFTQHLMDRKQLDRVGGPFVLTELLNFQPTSAHYPYFRNILLQKLKLRQIINLSAEAINDAYEAGDSDPAEILASLGGRVSGLESANEGGSRTMQQLAMLATDRYQSAFENKGALLGPSTGFPVLDSIIGGFVPKTLQVIAGATSDGKSAFALQILSAAATRGTPTALYTFEMPDEEEFDRMVAHRAQINSSAFKRGVFTRDELKRLGEATNGLMSLPFHIRDVSGMKLSSLLADMRLMKRKHGIKVFGIDYLQLVRPDNRGHSREREVAEISASLKAAAKTINCAVVALSQLNQQGRTKEATAIGEDADMVMTLSVPPKNPKDEHSEPDDTARIAFVSKNRNGERYKKIRYGFHGPTFTFTEQTIIS